MEFIRWGSLSSQKHKYYWGNKSHTNPQNYNLADLHRQFYLAPKKRGFYAFPLGLCADDLLRGGGSIATGRYSYLKDADGKKIMVRPVDYYDDHLDGWWLWSISYCSGNITPYYRDFLEKMGVNPEKVMIYSETSDGWYDPRVWLRRAYWGADHEPRWDEERNVDTEVTYPLVVENKPNRFSYEGNIWHHFETTYPNVLFSKMVNDNWNERLKPDQWEDNGAISDFVEDEYANYTTLVKPVDIIDKRGSWILTDMKVYKDVLNRVKSIYKHDIMQWMRKKSNMDDLNPYERQFQGIYSGLPRHSYITVDFEVFIEKIK